MNSLLKSLLRVGIDLLEQPERTATRMRDDVQDRVNRFTNRVSGRRRHNDALRTVANFAAGIGVGIGVGMLLAPASGKDTRQLIAEKTGDLGETVRDYFSSESSEMKTASM